MSAANDPGDGDFDPSEAALWIEFRTKGSQAAREKLFGFHLAFAKQIARRQFFDRSVGDLELADLIQLACAGLLESIDRFDPDRGTPFRAYAARRISGSVSDGIAKTTEVREQLSMRARVRRERVRSLADPAPTAESSRGAFEALADLAVGLAIGFMLEDTGLYQSETGPRQLPSAYESAAWKEAIGRLLHEVTGLPDRERIVVERHYLDGMSFDQIGSLLGVTKGRASQLHRGALDRLRKRLTRPAELRLKL